MISGRPLERLISDWASGHDLATVQHRFKCRQLLCESQLGLTDRPDQNVRILGAYFDRLSDFKTSRPRHGRRNPHSEAVSPLLLGLAVQRDLLSFSP
jgi:hypothetical protein